MLRYAAVAVAKTFCTDRSKRLSRMSANVRGEPELRYRSQDRRFVGGKLVDWQGHEGCGQAMDRIWRQESL